MLNAALEMRFKEKRTNASYLSELEHRTLRVDEKPVNYAADIKRLVFKGYPMADTNTRDTFNLRYFLKGLTEQKMVIAVGNAKP
jgi:hypothetical protein